MQLTRLLLAATLACARAHSDGRLTLLSPVALAGDYWTTDSLLSRTSFDLTVGIAIAATCPCRCAGRGCPPRAAPRAKPPLLVCPLRSWPASSIQGLNDELRSHALLLPDQICACASAPRAHRSPTDAPPAARGPAREPAPARRISACSLQEQLHAR